MLFFLVDKFVCGQMIFFLERFVTAVASKVSCDEVSFPVVLLQGAFVWEIFPTHCTRKQGLPLVILLLQTILGKNRDRGKHFFQICLDD